MACGLGYGWLFMGCSPCTVSRYAVGRRGVPGCADAADERQKQTERNPSLNEQGWLRFVVSHPFRKEREMDGAPSIFGLFISVVTCNASQGAHDDRARSFHDHGRKLFKATYRLALRAASNSSPASHSTDFG